MFNISSRLTNMKSVVESAEVNADPAKVGVLVWALRFRGRAGKPFFAMGVNGKRPVARHAIQW